MRSICVLILVIGCIAALGMWFESINNQTKPVYRKPHIRSRLIEPKPIIELPTVEPVINLPKPTIVESRNITIVQQTPTGATAEEISGVYTFLADFGPSQARGTCCLLNHNGKKFLVTAKHNLGDVKDIKLSVFQMNRAIELKIITQKILDIDIAIFEVETPENGFEIEDEAILRSIPKFELGIDPEIFGGVEITVCGYPDGFRKVQGKVWYYQSLNDEKGECRYLVSVRGKSCMGFSGSPWINKSSGKVIGIHVASITERSIPGAISVLDFVEALK